MSTTPREDGPAPAADRKRSTGPLAAWYRRHARSLRWRIQLWHAAILALVIVAFGAVLYLTQRHNRLQEINNELSSGVEVLVKQLRAAPPPALAALLANAGAPPPPAASKLRKDLRVPDTFAPRRYHHDFEVPYFAVWRADGTLVATSAPQRTGEMPEPGDARGPTRGPVRFRNRGPYREAFATGPPGTLVLVGRFVGPDLRDLTALAWLLAATGAGVFAVGLVGGWILSARSVRPIERINRVAAEISERNLSQRIDTERMDAELAELAEILNATFARLEAAFARQKKFTADASHELRTPLSVLQVHQQLALAKQRSPEEYRQTLETCQRATAQMNQLVESLLALARLDTDAIDATFESVDLTALAENCVRHIQPLADARQIEIATSLEPATVHGSASRLGQVITNLLTNAVVHCPAKSHVALTVRQQRDHATLTVADNGPGIAADELPHIFERFYRVNQERSRESGGAGLGLSICRAIVAAHGGTITAASQPGQGTTFEVTLPCDSEPSQQPEMQ